MLFRKRDKRGGAPPPPVRGKTVEPARPAFHKITFENLVKGSIIQRKGQPIRQYGLSLNGTVRMITSGDVVDEKTYAALVAVGAVKEEPQEPGLPEPLPPAGEGEPDCPGEHAPGN